MNKLKVESAYDLPGEKRTAATSKTKTPELVGEDGADQIDPAEQSKSPVVRTKVETTFAAGDHFGEKAILSDHTADFTAVAAEDSDILVLSRAKVNECLGSLNQLMIERHGQPPDSNTAALMKAQSR